MSVAFLEKWREWRLPGLLYARDLVLCGRLEEDLKVMCVRKSLKVLDWEEGSIHEVFVKERQLESVPEFN